MLRGDSIGNPTPRRASGLPPLDDVLLLRSVALMGCKGPLRACPTNYNHQHSQNHHPITINFNLSRWTTGPPNRQIHAKEAAFHLEKKKQILF
jgi:hypothetical protein